MKWELIAVIFSHAFVGWAVISTLIYLFLSNSSLIKRLIIQQINHLNLNDLLISKLERLDLNPLLEPIVDERLDALIDQYRYQIPMLSMFLTISLATKIKSMAKMEVLKALPEIQTQLIANADKLFNLTQVFDEYIQEIQFDAILRSHFKKKWYL